MHQKSICTKDSENIISPIYKKDTTRTPHFNQVPYKHFYVQSASDATYNCTQFGNHVFKLKQAISSNETLTR